MKIKYFDKEFDHENIDLVLVNSNDTNLGKEYYVEFIINGSPIKIDQTISLNKKAAGQHLKEILYLLDGCGSYVINSDKDFLCNVEKADNIDFYENLSPLGRKFFLRVTLLGETFDTVSMHNKKRYLEIEKKFRKDKNEEFDLKLKAILEKQKQ